jgi:NADPH:quinone reductase-like Zn-dependent oxidoreductase
MRAMEISGAAAEPTDIPKPVPDKGEVSVKVIASAVNAAEEKIMGGEFAGRFLHAKSSPLVLGWDFAGVVDLVGNDVSDLKPGIPVWGHLPYSGSTKQGAYAEYITILREQVAIKPDNMPFHVAAAAATVAMTSLQSLRDMGRLREGGTALIIGAAGGVGSVAVGIAKRLGAKVTAICSTKDVERVKTYGADEIIDRKKTNPFDTPSKFDVIFDTPAVHSFSRWAHRLENGGTYVTTLPDFGLLTGMIRTLFSSKRCKFVQVASKRKDLELVGEWLSDGMIVPIDSRYKVSDLSSALVRQTDPARSGRVVVDVENGWGG